MFLIWNKNSHTWLHIQQDKLKNKIYEAQNI